MNIDRRSLPNILITGSVGSGKTTFARQLAEADDRLTHVDVGQLALKEQCVTERNDQFDTMMLDEDKLLDALENRMSQPSGGVVADYHSSDFFPERWFDLVVVLRCDTATLFDRLKARGYSDLKVQENVQCEIFSVAHDEATSAYPSVPVLSLPSNETDELEANVSLLTAKVDEWLRAAG